MPSRPPSPVFEPTADPMSEYAAAPEAEPAAESVPESVRPETPLGEPIGMTARAGPSEAPSPGASLQGTRPPSPVASQTTFNPLDVDSDAEFGAAEERRKRREGKQRAKAVRAQREADRDAEVQQAMGRADAAVERLNEVEKERRDIREDRDRVLRELDRTRANKTMSDKARADAEAAAQSQLNLRNQAIAQKDSEVATAVAQVTFAREAYRALQQEFAKKESEQMSLRTALQQEREKNEGLKHTQRETVADYEQAKRVTAEGYEQALEAKDKEMQGMRAYMREMADQISRLQEASLAESSEKMSAQSRVQELESQTESHKELTLALATDATTAESQIQQERAERTTQSVRSSQQTMLYVENRHRKEEELMNRVRAAERAAALAKETPEYAQVRLVSKDRRWRVPLTSKPMDAEEELPEQVRGMLQGGQSQDPIYQGGQPVPLLGLNRAQYDTGDLGRRSEIPEPDDEVLEEMRIQEAEGAAAEESEESEELEIDFPLPRIGMDALLTPSAAPPAMTQQQRLTKRTLSQTRPKQLIKKKAAAPKK